MVRIFWCNRSTMSHRSPFIFWEIYISIQCHGEFLSKSLPRGLPVILSRCSCTIEAIKISANSKLKRHIPYCTSSVLQLFLRLRHFWCTHWWWSKNILEQLIFFSLSLYVLGNIFPSFRYTHKQAKFPK